MLERCNGRLAKARVIIGAAPGVSLHVRDGYVRYQEEATIIIIIINEFKEMVH